MDNDSGYPSDEPPRLPLIMPTLSDALDSSVLGTILVATRLTLKTLALLANTGTLPTRSNTAKELGHYGDNEDRREYTISWRQSLRT